MDLDSILTLLVEKGHLDKNVVPDILKDEDFQKKRKQRKKKTSEERRGHYDSNKCQARIWSEGYDNVQCSFSMLEGGCLCKKHQNCSDKDGGWWLGMIKEKRPEDPVWRGVQHYWRTDEEGNEIIKEEKKIVENEGGEKKKKRGRPKGSKNKKKEEKKKDLTIEEITELLEKKKKEREEAEAKKLKEEDEKIEEEEETIYLVDNVPYEINGEDVLDPDDFSPIGKIDGKGGIIFEDSEAEEKHSENLVKYSK